MILIADGGATKTDWRLLDNGAECQQVKTSGINPYLLKSEEIESILWKELQPHINNNKISKVFYYGAGCSNEMKNLVVENAFEKLFPNAYFSINHDLLAAAHALCGTSEGIAAILGTGSNTCHYDGEKIVNKLYSLGYVLGDEGSGAFLGKQLLSTYLHNELPKDLNQAFEEYYPHHKDTILDALYSKSAPSKFMASFSMFLSQHREHPFIANLLNNAFRMFFNYQVCIYPNYKQLPLHLVGSIAFYYQDVIKNIAKEFEVQIGNILQSPIDGLIAYHTTN